MLFQRPNPFPMSIRDNVVAGVKAHRIAKGKQLDVVFQDMLTDRLMGTDESAGVTDGVSIPGSISS